MPAPSSLQPLPSQGQRARRGLLVFGLLAAAVLWISGRLAYLPPWGLASLLLVSVLAGLWLAATPSRVAGERWLGGGLVASALLFVTTVFLPPSGPLHVERRAATPATPPSTLRLVNVNVLHGFPAFRDQETRYAQLAAALAALEPTVVVLQEAWSVAGHGQLAARLGQELGLDAVFASANGSRRLIGFEEGSAVLSRLPIRRAQRVVLAPRRPWWEIRVALFVTLEVAPGETLTVVSTHLVAGDLQTAAAQAEFLARRLPPAATLVVAGDLNAPSASAAARAFEAHGLRDALPGGIDHVFVPASDSPWQVANAAWTLRPGELEALIGEPVAISDHPGIVVDLERR